MEKVFMKINYNDVKDIISRKIKTEEIKQDGSIRYYNFMIMNLIEKIEPNSYADFGFSKVLAAYFDLEIDTEVSRVTLDDFNKVNKTMSQIEKNINDNVKTPGAIYMTRKDDDFCLMYYEVLN